MNFFNALFIIALVSLDMIVLEIIHKRNAKKCKYDCNTCKNWDCMVKSCKKKRNEINAVHKENAK